MYTRECHTFGFAGFEVGQQLNHVPTLRTRNKRGGHESWLGILSLYFQKLMARDRGDRGIPAAQQKQLSQPSNIKNIANQLSRHSSTEVSLNPRDKSV